MHMAGTASLVGFGLRSAAAQAQSAPRPIRRSERYDDSFIAERKPFKWPGNNTLAVWFAPNVEVWQYDSAFGVGIMGLDQSGAEPAARQLPGCLLDRTTTTSPIK